MIGKQSNKIQKGGKKPGAGRPAGVPNKSTTNAREAIARFVDGNAKRMNEWLERIALDDPKGAFTCLMSVMEYHLPKIQRTEVQALDANGNKADGFKNALTLDDKDIINRYMADKAAKTNQGE